MDKEQVRNYWIKKAKEVGNDPRSSMKDHEFREAEIELIKRYLQKEDEVLDVGCGNGFSTNEYSKYVKKIIGIDYIKEFIDIAKKLYQSNNLSFEEEDILNLKFKENSFDKVISERCIINLTTWEDQKSAIKNIYRVLKPSGVLIMAEVCIQGMKELDKMRNQFSIEPMTPHWHNLYLDEDHLNEFLKPMFKIEKIYRFTTYALLSKIFHSLYVKPDTPQFGAKFNKIARDITIKYPNLVLETSDGKKVENASHHLLYILKKIK